MILDGVRVLLIEHDTDNEEALRLLLEVNGAQVITAGSVSLGTASEEGKPSVVILDIVRPGECDCAGSSCGITAPVIAVSAWGIKGEREHVLESGCEAYLLKPYDPDSLIATVRALAARSNRPAAFGARLPAQSRTAGCLAEVAFRAGGAPRLECH